MLFLPFGGKTSPWGEGRSALALLPMTWRPLLNNVCTVALAQRQITMSQHDQSNMTVKTSPTAPLIMIESQFSFGVLIESLNNPADMSKFNQFFQAESSPVSRQNNIYDPPCEPTWRWGVQSRANLGRASVHLDSPLRNTSTLANSFTRGPFVPIPPCNSLPSFGRQLLRDFSCASRAGMRSLRVEAFLGLPRPL